MLLDLPTTPFVSQTIHVGVAREAWQVRGYHQLRQKIFCDEQQLFELDDHDSADMTATPIVAWDQQMGFPGDVVGVVRIYQQQPGIWFGGRLGVDPDYRRHGYLGAHLIRCAVTTAHAWGATEFYAYVQEENVRLFRWLRWHPLEALELHGKPHRRMIADLAHYPPATDAPDRASLATQHMDNL